MAVRSDRLGATKKVPDSSFAALFTVPAGETWLVKRLTQYSPTGSTVYWVMSPSGEDGLVIRTDQIAADQGVDVETWWALDAGCSLGVFNAGTSILDVQAYGAKLEGVA